MSAILVAFFGNLVCGIFGYWLGSQDRRWHCRNGLGRCNDSSIER